MPRGEKLVIFPYSKTIILTAFLPPAGYFYIASFGFYKNIFPAVASIFWIMSCAVWLFISDDLVFVLLLNNLLLVILVHQFEWSGQSFYHLIKDTFINLKKTKVVDENLTDELPPRIQRVAALFQAAIVTVLILWIVPAIIVPESMLLWLGILILSLFYLVLSSFCYACPAYFVKKSLR